MEIRFSVTGAERKKLVTAVNEILGEPMNYMGAPTFAYIVGEYTIDRNGTLTGDGSISSGTNDRLIKELNQRGFIGEVADRGDSEERLVEAEPANTEIDGLTIEMPREGFTDTAIDNLEKMVMSKAALIKKAIGADALPIEVTDDKVFFPWFHSRGDEAQVRAYTKFIAALCNTAKEQKRVTAKEKPVDNEKYAFRCFLLRLGFIGEEYKADRKILLRNLSGNGSFKSGSRNNQPMRKLKCLHCGFEFNGTVETDELGLHSSCPECEGSFDVDEEVNADE